ncbi:MAG: phenylalanine--tRNA ligase beta subunit-related protein [Kofleriaceae bacterium]
MTLTVSVADHPLLELDAFITRFARPLGELVTPPSVLALLEPQATAPICSSDTVRAEVRALLRQAGFKPAGRSKPASEYLHAVQQEGNFPAINAAVDVCNVVSLHSGLPISLVDLDATNGALRIDLAPPGTSYPFNPSGQLLEAGGLCCLFDTEGPTGTPVKDAQRTKTHGGTRVTLSIIWGTRTLNGRTRKTGAWYRDLVAAVAGATIEPVELVR